MDQGLLSNSGVIPVSLNLSDQLIQIQDGTTLSGIEGISLQLTNTGGQPGLHITGLDPALLSQPLPLHIDNNLLAQLQQGANVNVTFNTGVTGGQITNVDEIQGAEAPLLTGPDETPAAIIIDEETDNLVSLSGLPDSALICEVIETPTFPIPCPPQFCLNW